MDFAARLEAAAALIAAGSGLLRVQNQMSEKKRAFTAHLFRVGAYVAAFFWLAFVWGAVKVLSVPDTGKHSLTWLAGQFSLLLLQQ
jgi:hypothetical protein